MSIITAYLDKIKSNQLTYGDRQYIVIDKLDILRTQIEKECKNNFITNFFLKLYQQLPIVRKNKQLQGMYVYSDVGRGKTLLMDLFYNNLAINKKYKCRLHFHLFMRMIHQAMVAASGKKDPLTYVIKYQFNYKVICLDEFMVTDIADAVILARIIQALINNKVYLITTSNVCPDDLYKNGLQRGLFLPAIKLIKNNLAVIQLTGNIDYRAQMFQSLSCYYLANSKENMAKLNDIFLRLATSSIVRNSELLLVSRKVKFLAKSGNVIWFDFNMLCKTSRSALDYIELANLYQTVIVSGVYELSDNKPSINNIVRRFINLVDILYDHKVNLILCADVLLEQLYPGEPLRFEFARTLSRLKEMQTQGYLEQMHSSGFSNNNES